MLTVLQDLDSEANERRDVERQQLLESLFVGNPADVPFAENLQLHHLSHVDIDTDGFLVTCVGFHPECWRESEGLRFKVKGVGPLKPGKYEIACPVAEQRQPMRRRVENLHTIVFDAAGGEGSPGVTAGLMFMRTVSKAPMDEQETHAERRVISTFYIQLLHAAHSAVAKAKLTLEQFENEDYITVPSLKVHEFAQAFRRGIESLPEAQQQTFGIQSMRTFFQLQHGHRNLMEEMLRHGVNEVLAPSPAAVLKRLQGAVFDRFDMALVTSVSVQLGKKLVTGR